LALLLTAAPRASAFITVSPGPTLTQEDLDQFDAKWMQPAQQDVAVARAAGNLYAQTHDAIVWETSERMEAMVRMYDLTRDPRYLDHLQEFVEWALVYRDDNHPGPAPCLTPTIPIPEDGAFDDCRPPHQLPLAAPGKGPAGWPVTFDHFRAQAGLPAWGGRGVGSGGLHGVNETSFGFAYALAAFARIVAEDPRLHPHYGAKAIDVAHAALQTVQVFVPQLRLREADAFPEATLIGLDRLSSLPTPTQCEDAYQQALDDDPEADQDRLRTARRNCLELHHFAGIDMAHNWNQWYMMGLIELWKALDSPWYRTHPAADPAAALHRVLLPLLVARLHRNFVTRLLPVGSGETAHFYWNYNDGLPEAIATHDENTPHGALDMRGLEVLRANMDRLNAVTVPLGEPIALDPTHLRRFANTFLHKIVVDPPDEWFRRRPPHLAEDVLGNPAYPIDKYNGNCDGWMNLAIADARVYQTCHEISLRVVNGTQPYLNIANHAALLMNKRWLPAAPPQPPADIGDSTSDILWRNVSTGEFAAWLMANGHVGAALTLYTEPAEWQVQGIGTFD
jgi:hypothetical protein